jgi:chitinase
MRTRLNRLLAAVAVAAAVAVPSAIVVGGPAPSAVADTAASVPGLRVSYLQLGATGSLAQIDPAGIAASNVIVFAFADPAGSTADPAVLAAMQKVIDHEAEGTVNLLSLGGQTVTRDTVNTGTASAVGSRLLAQIEDYNAKLTGGSITGVDLDLENGIDAETISALGATVTGAGLSLAVAPQVYLSSGTDVDPASPTNLTLTSGVHDGANDQFGPLVASGTVDYLRAQTYNTGGWTVGGVGESDPRFFSTIGHALNSAVRPDCFGATSLCIADRTKIVIGQVSNAGASGTANNVFGGSGAAAYDQAAVLASLASQWTAMAQEPALYGHVAGVMQWSLNNDYAPSAWGDASAAPGAFSVALFGATPPAPSPYFLLQVSNTGPDSPDSGAYASATLVVDSQYWIFGNKWGTALSPGANESYGTSASSRNPATPYVIDSSSLDSIFAGGRTSFTASQVLINGYSSQSDVGTPGVQYSCPLGAGYTFEAGHSYNVQVNANSDYRSCAISKVS